MYNLEKLALRQWMRNLADDRTRHADFYRRLVAHTAPRDRMFYLELMACARRCIAIDKVQMTNILRDMSLCADCEKTSLCVCLPPF